ncbi:MAG: hypothetical protein PVJ33_00090 [Lysobacterales bacterium]|jgi:2,3-bisphosphoglycerate-independent phosphoglycerate mutase
MTPVHCVLFIVDGLGDCPVPALGGKTPLEAAATPVMDHFAGLGTCGLVDPLRPGEIPNTDTGAGMLLGLAPEQAGRLRRGPVEASGAGRLLDPGEIAIRANFATLESSEIGLLVHDRRAGRITSGTAELAAALDHMDLGDGITAEFVCTDQHRGVIVLSGPGLDAHIGDTDPGDREPGLPLLRCESLKPAADFTAAKVDAFIAEAHRRLLEHPVNLQRRRDGKLPANGVITRGAGAAFTLDNVVTARGIRAAVVAGCNTILGLSRIFGLDTVHEPRFTADLDTDLDGKIASALRALDDHEMVYVHVKAPDLCAHDRHPLQKRDFLERLDRAMAPLAGCGAMVALAADHTTDSNTGAHTGDPVPAFLCPPGVAPGARTAGVHFGESACRTGNLPRQSSHEFLLHTLGLMGF